MGRPVSDYGRYKINRATINPKQDPLAFYRFEILRNSIDTCKAMKRQFCGLPVVFAREMWGEPKATSASLEDMYSMKGKPAHPLHHDWWIETKNALPSYMNHKGYFLDAQGALWSRVEGDEIRWLDGKTHELYADKSYSGQVQSTFSLHLGNLGHRLHAEWLGPRLEAIAQADYASSGTDHCEAAFGARRQPESTKDGF